MNTRDPRTASAARYPPATSRIPRRLVLRLAASAAAAAVLAGCGEKELTRDSYDFPGARKDSTGNLPDAQRPIASVPGAELKLTAPMPRRRSMGL